MIWGCTVSLSLMNVNFGSDWFCSVQFSSVRFGSVRFGLVRFSLVSIQMGGGKQFVSLADIKLKWDGRYSTVVTASKESAVGTQSGLKIHSIYWERESGWRRGRVGARELFSTKITCKWKLMAYFLSIPLRPAGPWMGWSLCSLPCDHLSLGLSGEIIFWRSPGIRMLPNFTFESLFPQPVGLCQRQRKWWPSRGVGINP